MDDIFGDDYLLCRRLLICYIHLFYAFIFIFSFLLRVKYVMSAFQKKIVDTIESIGCILSWDFKKTMLTHDNGIIFLVEQIILKSVT